MKQWSVNELEEFGRTQLSPNFFMRDFLYSEISQIHGISNLPDHPELAIVAGKQLCEKVLEPIQESLGRIAIRSAYRSPAVNAYGNTHRLNCSRNEANYAAHIWDYRDANGKLGATACIVVPSFLEHLRRTGDWTALAWWVHENIPAYREMCFFSKLAAFNISWYEDENTPKTIRSYAVNPHTGDKKALVDKGEVNPFYQGKDLSSFYLNAFESRRTSNAPSSNTVASMSSPINVQRQDDPADNQISVPAKSIAEGTDPKVLVNDFASRYGLSTRPTGGANANGVMICRSGKTVFTVYHSATDQPGYFEVAFSPNLWTGTQLDNLATGFESAEPKTSHKWPRIGFKRRYLEEVLAAIAKEKFA